MPEQVSSLRVVIPDIRRGPISDKLEIPNLNPHCGPRPLHNIKMYFEKGEYANFSAEVSSGFVDAMIKPRGRPHWTLLHMALVDDDLASASFCAITDEIYGEAWRYVELWASCCFHREAFIKDWVKGPTKGAIEVDSFQVFWELVKEKPRSDLMQRGLWRVAIFGIRNQEPIHIASLEGKYFRLHAVKNIFPN